MDILIWVIIRSLRDRRGEGSSLVSTSTCLTRLSGLLSTCSRLDLLLSTSSTTTSPSLRQGLSRLCPLVYSSLLLIPLILVLWVVQIAFTTSLISVTIHLHMVSLLLASLLVSIRVELKVLQVFQEGVQL